MTEALWKGKPVVGGSVGGVPLQVIDGKTGFLVAVLGGPIEVTDWKQLRGQVPMFALRGQGELVAGYRFFAKLYSVFVLTALYEPFGLAPLEAMAAGQRGHLAVPDPVGRFPVAADSHPRSRGSAAAHRYAAVLWPRSEGMGGILAFAAMITVPVLIVFVLFQKGFVQSVATSGIKGGA